MIALLPKRFVKLIEFSADLRFLFTGDGNVVKIYGRFEGDWCLAKSLVALERSNVHGLECKGHEFVCFFGEKHFSLYTVRFVNKRIDLHALIKNEFATDWILDVKFMSNEKLLFLLAHNSLAFFDVKSGQIDRVIFGDEICILYSGLLYGNNWPNIRVISGTVFGHILIWSPERTVPEIRLIGHRGAIFDIAVNEPKRLLCSVADDRTCKVWVSNQPNSDDCPNFLSNGDFVCLHTFYGHEARIWKCLFTKAGLVTVGEDSRINLWHTVDGSLIDSFSTCRGSIRSSCFDATNNELICGTDSGSLFSINLAGTCPKNAHMLDQLNEVLNKEESFTNVMFAQDKSIIAITNQGSLIRYQNPASPIRLFVSSSLRYCCHTKAMDWLFLGDLHGFIYAVNINESPTTDVISKCKVNDGKIFSLVALHRDRRILATFVDGKAALLAYDNTTGLICSNSNRNTLILPQGKHPWATCCLEFRSKNCEFLVIGDRNGFVCFYEMSADNFPCGRCQIFPKIHGSHGVTDLVNGPSATVFSIGRDGMRRHWALDLENRWTVVDAARVGQMFEWPSKFIQIDEHRLLIAGFKGNKFTVYDTTLRRYLCDVECGGGHRSYDLSINFRSNRAVFLFCKSGRIYESQIDLNQEKGILPHLHNRHIKQILAIEMGQSAPILATCSEDTTVTLWNVDERSDCGLRLIQRLKSKLCSILCMSFDVESKLLITAGGKGELCLWHTVYLTSFTLSDHFKMADDVRCLSISFFRITGGLHICLCRSDGVVNFLRIEGLSARMTLLKDFTLHSNCCLNKLKCFENYLFVVGTNGFLFALNLDKVTVANDSDDAQRWTLSAKVEKCGLTAIDVTSVKKGEESSTIYCAIGSESGAVSMCKLATRDNDISLVYCMRYNAFHSSTVTDIRFFDDKIYVLSVDQRISVWDYKTTPDGTHCSDFIKAQFISVADCSSFCFIKELSNKTEQSLNRLFVVGSGLQSIML